MRLGLLPKPQRSASGYRRYPDDAVRRVRFIKRAQELGFTLTEVDTLLHLAGGGPDSCDQTRAMASGKITDLERRIADLQALHDGLTGLTTTCDRPHAERDCPILQRLDPGEVFDQREHLTWVLLPVAPSMGSTHPIEPGRSVRK
ncbi:MerR, DNA binding [Lentzea albidocapillata subsp. violacea]|uniref:MerR, DNA binding n=1 Tax=Lentzea albidocapillata subsp. violacea TaxID=128104 RepID=A0A1G9YB35_9PSEU|nr:MerR family DNA-binding protein [Lentzea albidocapillata]SDN06282.1 MerR, DNA binding [Lentzea albidocapillata subsp. violacea]